MKKVLPFILVVFQLCLSCSNETQNDFLEKDYKILKDKVDNNTRELHLNYLHNSVKCQSYFKTYENISNKIAFIEKQLLANDYENVQSLIRNLESEILNNSIFDSNFFNDKVLKPRLHYWISDNSIKWTKRNVSTLKWDLLNLNNETIAYLVNRIDKYSFKFNKLIPIVKDSIEITDTGRFYLANIYLAAIDTTMDLEVFISDISQPDSIFMNLDKKNEELNLLPVENGIGVYRKRIIKNGKDGFKGIIGIRIRAGVKSYYYFENEYEIQ